MPHWLLYAGVSDDWQRNCLFSKAYNEKQVNWSVYWFFFIENAEWEKTHKISTNLVFFKFIKHFINSSILIGAFQCGYNFVMVFFFCFYSQTWSVKDFETWPGTKSFLAVLASQSSIFLFAQTAFLVSSLPSCTGTGSGKCLSMNWDSFRTIGPDNFGGFQAESVIPWTMRSAATVAQKLRWDNFFGSPFMALLYRRYAFVMHMFSKWKNNLHGQFRLWWWS